MFAETIRTWQKLLPEAEARSRIKDLISVAFTDPRGITVDDVLAWIAKVEALPKPAPAPKPAPTPEPVQKRRHRRMFNGEASIAPEPAPAIAPDPASPAKECRGRPSKRAQALVREQLEHGPRPAEQVHAAAQAAEIPEPALIAAADALGVRTRKGQWWLPQACWDAPEDTPPLRP